MTQSSSVKYLNGLPVTVEVIIRELPVASVKFHLIKCLYFTPLVNICPRVIQVNISYHKVNISYHSKHQSELHFPNLICQDVAKREILLADLATETKFNSTFVGVDPLGVKQYHEWS